jgi:leader peptidase (prepilin peptidase) / N-methyltransferase
VVVWPTFLGVAVLGCLSAWLERDADALVRAWIGAAGVFACFYALWWIHPPGMGFGDVRLSAVLGFALAYLGWGEVLVGVYGAFLAFAVPGLLVAAFRRDRGVLKVAYPFGPFLLVGALAGVVLGDPLWSGLVSG